VTALAKPFNPLCDPGVKVLQGLVAFVQEFKASSMDFTA
jgi:hypothetical protein